MQGTWEPRCRSLSVRPLGVGFRDPAARPRLETARKLGLGLTAEPDPWEGRALDPDVM